MKKQVFAAFTLLIMCSLMVGCMSKKEMERGKAQVKKPINCATAEQDIKILESEKARLVRVIATGASAITPIGAALNILQRKQINALKVGCGAYNRMIDKKIAEIKKTCNIK